MVSKYITDIIHSQKGFSFIELIICLTLIIICCSFMTVGFKTVDDMSLEYEAIYLVNELRGIQRKNNQSKLTEIFNGKKSNDKANLVISDYHRYIVNNFGETKIHQLPDDILIYANQKKIFFSDNNTASGVTICLDKGKSELKVIIDTVGRIRIMR